MLFKKKKRPSLFDLKNSTSSLLFKGLLIYVLFYYGLMSSYDIDVTNVYIRYSMIGIMVIIGVGVFFHKFKKLTTKKEKQSFARIVFMLVAFAGYMLLTGGGL